MKCMEKWLCTLYSAVAAGFLIGIGGTAYVICGSPYVGILLFCVGLFTICTYGLRLYTGAVGYVGWNRTDMTALLITWVGNLIGTWICGTLMRTAIPEKMTISTLFLSYNLYKTLVLSALCGTLMFIAVDTYRAGTPHKYIGIFLCVPAFLTCGFEHSVAEMFYAAASGQFWTALPHILVVSVGNAIGALVANATKRHIQPRPCESNHAQ